MPQRGGGRWARALLGIPLLTASRVASPLAGAWRGWRNDHRGRRAAAAAAAPAPVRSRRDRHTDLIALSRLCMVECCRYRCGRDEIALSDGWWERLRPAERCAEGWALGAGGEQHYGECWAAEWPLAGACTRRVT